MSAEFFFVCVYVRPLFSFGVLLYFPHLGYMVDLSMLAIEFIYVNKDAGVGVRSDYF